MTPIAPSAPRLYILANALMAILAVLVAVQMVRALAVPHPLPPPPTRETPKDAATGRDERWAPVEDDGGFEGYRVITDRPLFNPSRREPSPAVAAAVVPPLPAVPRLHGIVLDGKRTRAYIEERDTARVLAYGVGDTVAGGVIEAIEKDRVSIRRAGVTLRVMLVHPATAPAQPRSSARREPAAGTGLPAALDALWRKSRAARWERRAGRSPSPNFLTGRR